MRKKALKIILQHKIAVGLVVLVVAVGGCLGYKTFKNGGEGTRYLLAAVEKGTIIVSVSGSGQVSASNQVDIKPKVSGDAIYAGLKNGQEVKKGTLLTELDSRDAKKTVRDAEASLESARLSLEKLKKPADELSILQAENALAQAKESKQKVEDNLKKAYEDGFNAVTNLFLDLPTIMAGWNDMFFDSSIERGNWNIDWYANQVDPLNFDKVKRYKDDVYSAYNTARQRYKDNFDHYKSASRIGDVSTIETLISETYETVKLVADAVKTSKNYIDFVEDIMEQRDTSIPSVVSTHQSSLNNYTGKTNSHLISLLSVKRTIEDAKDSIVNADRAIAEKAESLAKIKASPDPLDLQSQELAVRQRENALLDAKEKLADYFVRAPFDGIITKANLKKGDSVSANTAVATLITKQRLAEISLNEVDAAKIEVGQKATLAFDAVESLSITGVVSEIDSLGTVTQGVVTYNVKIGFDTQDERIKPGMSVSAAIITEVKQDALLIPNSAVKSQGDRRYVETLDKTASSDRLLASAVNSAGVFSKTPPREQAVEVGLSNDSLAEITSGLKEGDIIVVRAISSSSKTQSQQSENRSLLQSVGGVRSGGQDSRGVQSFMR